MGVLLLISTREEVPYIFLNRKNFSVFAFQHPKPTKTQIKMPDQPETVAAEVPVTEDATDAPVKEATKEAVPEQASEEVANGAAEGGEEAPATE